MATAMKTGLFISAIVVVFFGLAGAITASGGDPTGGLGHRAAGLLLLAGSIALVWGIAALVRHRRRLAARAEDSAAAGAALAVKAGRTLRKRAERFSAKVSARLDNH